MTTYQDRARKVIRKYRDEVDLNRDRYSSGGEDNYNAIEDQALSELASIVEEEIIGKDEIRDQHFGDNAVYFKDGAPERNAFRAKQRDQLSNRSK